MAKSKKIKNLITVDEYIANCPKDVQGKLQEIRSAIKEVAPDATERTDYFQLPGYSLDGDYAYSGMFAWFSFKDPYIRVHVIPPVVENHKKELAGNLMAKGSTGFPKEKEIPILLVKKLVQESIKVMKDKS